MQKKKRLLLKLAILFLILLLLCGAGFLLFWKTPEKAEKTEEPPETAKSEEPPKIVKQEETKVELKKETPPAATNKPNSEPLPELSPPGDQFDLLTEYQGHQYYISKSTVSWKEAYARCQKYGGHLVTVTSDAENKAIVQAIRSKNIKRDIWIGFTDEKSEGKWEWVTGEKVDFTDWDMYQPDNASHDNVDEDYAWLWQQHNAQFNKNPLKWNDTINADLALFILEKD
jgi:hypothetical protein